MTFNTFSILAICVMLSGSCRESSSTLKGSVTGNNSGDAIKALFADARVEAANTVRYYDFSVWNSETNVTRFMRKNDLVIAKEIDRVEFDWGDKNQATCASTNSDLGSPFYFDYKICRRSIQTSDDAARIIIHESIHHFGIGNSAEDERFADTVAGEFIRARKLTMSRQGPLFSAIAYSTTSGIYGITNNYGTKEAGLEKAKKICGDNCNFELSDSGSCVALFAVRNIPSKYSWWNHQNLENLKLRTKASCEQSHGIPCFEVASGCSLGAATQSSSYSERVVNVYNSRLTLTVDWSGPSFNDSPIDLFNSDADQYVSLAYNQRLKLNLYNSVVTISAPAEKMPFIDLAANFNSSVSYK